MIAAWLVYGAFIGLFVAVAARAAESLGRLLGYPVRWVWLGALALTVTFVGIAPLRPPAPDIVKVALSQIGGSGIAVESSWIRLQRIAELPMHVLQSSGSRLRIEPATERAISAIWIAVSGLLVALFFAVHARVRLARRRWPETRVLGVRVRVAPNAGPAVVGIAKPEIVIPSWLLGRDEAEQRLVLAHELEHLRVRDPLLLSISCVLTALMPWNPAVWWMLSRLRLAIELDCDARVLRGGVAARSYGTLLIDLAERCSAFRTTAPALADDTSHLQQRILAMNAPSRRFAFIRGGAVGVLALGCLLVACEAKLPTTAEIDRMDARGAEQGARKALMLTRTDTVSFIVDGKPVTATLARSVASEKIAGLAITKENGRPEVRINTWEPVAGVAIDTVHEHAERRVEPRSEHMVPLKSAKSEFEGLLLINGERATQAQLDALDRASIVSVDVIKGAAAKAYGEPAATYGVIKIVTR